MNKEYPYLGKSDIEGVGSYVVLFSEQEKGTIVMSDVQDKDSKLKVGYIGTFDESLFTPLEKGICVRLEN